MHLVVYGLVSLLLSCVIILIYFKLYYHYLQKKESIRVSYVIPSLYSITFNTDPGQLLLIESLKTQIEEATNIYNTLLIEHTYLINKHSIVQDNYNNINQYYLNIVNNSIII